jgi:hypothetical protein
MVPAVFWRGRYHRPVRRLVQVAIIALGIRALLRWRKRRRAEAKANTEAQPASADPADELRQKLAESRGDDATEESPAATNATVEDRRSGVHEEGRAALDDMKSSDEG